MRSTYAPATQFVHNVHTASEQRIDLFVFIISANATIDRSILLQVGRDIYTHPFTIYLAA